MRGTGLPAATSASSGTRTPGPTPPLRIDGWLARVGIGERFLLPLLLVNVVVLLLAAAFLSLLVHSPWGRVLKAIREDEDAVRALGKNTFAYKLQSLSLAAALAAISGYMLALNISILSPRTLTRS